MANIERGMRELEVLTDYLNDIIIKTGKPIERDNHGLWKKFFHHYNNEDWDNMLEALDLIHEHYPEAFEVFNTQALRQAREILADKGSESARVLDTKPYKTQAWRCAMSIREVINRLNGVNIPNAPSH